MTRRQDHYCRWSYRQLIVGQPHVKFEGLWANGHLHFVACPNYRNELTSDGKPLDSWFNHSCRVITAPVQLVESPPPGAERVPEHSLDEAIALAGAPRTARDILTDLSLLLPAEFPEFFVDNPGVDVVLVTRRELTEAERSTAETTFASLGDYPPLKFAVDPGRNAQQHSFRSPYGQGDLDLIPSRQLNRSTFGRDLRFIVEDDDDFWASQRAEIFSNPTLSLSVALPHDWSSRGALRCLLNASVSASQNLRNHLSLYETVLINAPLADRMDEVCKGLGATPSELIALAELGRVKFILPQSVDRYGHNWLSELAERTPNSLLLSRRLAAATILDSRVRIPLLYPPLSPHERYAVLHAISSDAETLVGRAQAPVLKSFVAGLAETWTQPEGFVHSRGAMGTAHLGIGFIASFLVSQFKNVDLRLELWSAAQKVEWAAALGAHTFADELGTYDEAPACDLVAGLYSPNLRLDLLPPRTALNAIGSLLAIDSNAPIVPFAKELSSASISRLRDVVLDLARNNVDSDYLQSAIEKFNEDVRHYEKRPDLLKSLNVVGLVGASATAAGAVAPAIAHLVPLGGLLLGFLLNRAIEEVPRSSENLGRMIDFANALLAGQARPDVVLVARTKKDLARIKRA